MIKKKKKTKRTRKAISIEKIHHVAEDEYFLFIEPLDKNGENREKMYGKGEKTWERREKRDMKLVELKFSEIKNLFTLCFFN